MKDAVQKMSQMKCSQARFHLTFQWYPGKKLKGGLVQGLETHFFLLHEAPGLLPRCDGNEDSGLTFPCTGGDTEMLRQSAYFPTIAS